MIRLGTTLLFGADGVVGPPLVTEVPTEAVYLGFTDDEAGGSAAFFVRGVGRAPGSVYLARGRFQPAAPLLTVPASSVVYFANRSIAYATPDGVFLADGRSQGQQLLVSVPCAASTPPRDCRRYAPRAASPDGRLLLVDVGFFEGGQRRVFDLQTGTLSRPVVGVGSDWAPTGARLCGSFESYGGPQVTIAVDDLAQSQAQVLTWPSGRAPNDIYGKEVDSCRWSGRGEVAVLTRRPVLPASGRQGYSIVFFDEQLGFTSAYELPKVRLIGWAPDDSGVVIQHDTAYYVFDRQGALRSLDVGGGTIVDIMRPRR